LEFTKAYPPNWDVYFNTDNDTTEILRAMLSLDPAKRISADDALKHE